MATLNQKTDEIAALEALKKDLANWEDKLKKATKKEVADKIKAKIADIKKQIKEGKTSDKEVSAKQLADSLLKSRKKFLEMSKKDFNGVVRQLAKRPEYAFLKGYTRQEIIDDIQRKAKPVGWRFKGRGNYKTPTPEQVRRGRRLGTVYYENRPNRSDVSQTKQLAKGGSTYAEGGGVKENNYRVSVAKNDKYIGEYTEPISDINEAKTIFAQLESKYKLPTYSISVWKRATSTSGMQKINVSSWYENTDKYAKGGGVDANYSGEYFSIRDFVNSNKGMDEIISKLYKLNIEDVDDNLDGELGYDTEVIRNVLKGKGYRVTYNDDTEYIIVKKMLPKFSKGGSTYQGGGEVAKSYLHLYKLTYPNGEYTVEAYDGDYMTPKEALEKMRISLRGLKSYKYSGASSDSANYKKWHHKKDIGYSNTEAWDEVFGSEKYAKGGSTYQGGGEIIKNTIVYDNEGETLDRYTVFTPDGSVYAMSENAKGFNQYVGEAVEDNIEQGSHLGKKLKSVPKEIEWAIIDRMNYAKGGSTYQGGGEIKENLPYCIYVTNLNNPNSNSELVAKVKAKGDALLITSELNKSLHRDTPLVYTMKEKKYEDGGNLEPMDEDDLPVVRYYFEDDEYEYEDGGEIDINDINIPVHYTMFEDEMYEYARGGHVSKGEMVWNKLSQSKRMEFLYKHFTPEITPRSQEIVIGKNWNFLPKKVKIKFEAVYANIEDY